VYREGEYERAYVGTIEVLRTQPDRSVCRVLEELSQRPIVKGDRVAPELAGKVVTLTARTVSIDATGKITLEGAPVALPELPEALCSAVSDPARVHLWIAAHPDVEYSRIVELITECSSAGIPKFSYVAHPDTRDTRAPAAEPTSETPKTDAATLNIDAEGRITLNGVKITLDVLPETLQGLGHEPDGKGPAVSEVLVVAHPDASHQRVVEVLDACAQAGVAGVRLAVAGDEEPTRPLPIPRAEPKPAED
jgi:biopolymer transport protein ExbD